MDSGTTVLVSALTSTAVAAVFTGLFTGRNERKKQLLESRRTLAGDFSGDAMEALAKLRHYKPTTKPGHRNEDLRTNLALRAERAEEVNEVIDRLRPKRGRVWVTFPGRSSVDEIRTRGPKTTADWAERVIGLLREVQETCDNFWRQSDQTKPRSRAELEQHWDQEYDTVKEEAWAAIDQFTDSAARWLEPNWRARLRDWRSKVTKRQSTRRFEGTYRPPK